MEPHTEQNHGSGVNLTIPAAIIIAGALIAGAVMFTSSGGPQTQDTNNAQNTDSQAALDIRPVSEDDHVRGNPNAPITIIEYSDFECPYCQNFHDTMQRIMSEYGRDGTVAWVYRQFPIANLHPKAPEEAEASECAAKLGGNEGFWAFADRLFEVTPSNDGLDLSTLPDIAEFAGIDRTEFETCLESGETKPLVDEDVAEARAYVTAASRQTGQNYGTPTSVILVNGERITDIPGALPYEAVAGALDSIIEERL